MADDWTKFPPVGPIVKSVCGPKPVLIGILGPPGSGKTRSMLRMMRGCQRVFTDRPIILIDTEAGRSKKYSPPPGGAATPDDPIEPTYDFDRIDLDAPFRGDRCWAAVKLALEKKPAAIGFDNLSDEHSGEGGYLWWHDQEVERVGGNDWGAWARPSAARKKLLTGISHVSAPPILFFTFISEEKTDQVTVKDERTGRDKKKVVNKGWTPVAPLMVLKTLDLTCILPWDSKGTPIWESRHLPHEDFVRKWPDQLTRLFSPGQITEEHGEALARWAKGEPAGRPAQAPPPAAPPPNQEEAGLVEEIKAELARHQLLGKPASKDAIQSAFGMGWGAVTKLPADQLRIGLEALTKQLDGLAALREPGQDEEEESHGPE